MYQTQEKVSKVTLLTRRKVESVEGIDVSQEESEGRLIQHVQGIFSLPVTENDCSFHCLDLDELTDEKAKELCTGSNVFFNCLGTTKAKAGSAVRPHTHTKPKKPNVYCCHANTHLAKPGCLSPHRLSELV